MTQILRPAASLLLAFSLLLGLAYPMAITGLANLLLPDQAQGSLIRDGEVLRGSRLLAQGFTGAGYFHPRPSAGGHDPLASGGSNLGPTSARLIARIADSAPQGQSADAVTTSASGLDPDISPANAKSQIARVAAARGIAPETLAGLVAAQTVPRLWGLIGERHVNVLALNRALDRLAP